MKTTNFNGVRAEPTFLRDPTSFETFSNGIGRLSSYVANNLPKKRTENTFEEIPSQNLEEIVVQEDKESETVSFAEFDRLSKDISCLMLGYQDGFQLWNITSPDNIHEICSIRDSSFGGTVSCIHLLNRNPHNIVLAIVTEHDKKSNVFIYSVKSYSILHKLSLDIQSHEDHPVLITSIQSNHKIIALACLSRHKSSIHLISAKDYKPVSTPLLDVYHNINSGPIFTLGSRLIAYATSATVLNKDPVMSSFSNKLQVENDVKGAAKDIAKEVVSGMKSLGEFSYHQLSNYFGNNFSMPATPASLPVSIQSDKDGLMRKNTVPSGMAMIRDINKLSTNQSGSMSHSILAHFRPHTHPISCLAFNPSGTLLMSASKQGHNFNIFSILSHTHSKNSVSHLYNLSRGYTDAHVDHCQFSNDSNWCAISTARGTTHVYAINPYGGRPELSGHIHNKVNNNRNRYAYINKTKPKSTTVTALGPVLRIKQRKQITEEELYINNIGSPQLLPVSRLQKEPKAKVASSFVEIDSKLSYFINHNEPHINNTKSMYNTTLKQQASHMLRSLPYLPQSNSSNSDPLMFGFDEEYEDDSVKAANDEIGSQILYTFHPSGTLTLHKCWVTKSIVKRRESNRESLDLSMKKESIAEWKVARHSDWSQVKNTVDPKKANEDKVLADRNPFWLSNAEISTYSTLEEPPIWSQSQCVFQIFQETDSLKAGLMPATDTLVMPKEMPEPVSSRIDRVSKTNTRAENDDVEENMEDALAELEDNLSNAMQTSFSVDESTNNSPVKWLSTSANAVPNSSAKFFSNKNSSVSFEDAYLINMGSTPVEKPLQSPIFQFDNEISQISEEDLIRFENCDTQLQDDLYSPDGDNEAAYPYESIFEGFYQNDGSNWQ